MILGMILERFLDDFETDLDDDVGMTSDVWR